MGTVFKDFFFSIGVNEGCELLGVILDETSTWVSTGHRFLLVGAKRGVLVAHLGQGFLKLFICWFKMRLPHPSLTSTGSQKESYALQIFIAATLEKKRADVKLWCDNLVIIFCYNIILSPVLFPSVATIRTAHILCAWLYFYAILGLASTTSRKLLSRVATMSSEKKKLHQLQIVKPSFHHVRHKWFKGHILCDSCFISKHESNNTALCSASLQGNSVSECVCNIHTYICMCIHLFLYVLILNCDTFIIVKNLIIFPSSRWQLFLT